MHKLKENLKKELYEFEDKIERNPHSKMSLQELQRANLASDTVKNLCKIEKLEESEGYSEDGTYMGEGRIYGTSYARGRGRNARRDRMGRYSSDDGMSYDDDMSYARDGRGGNRGMRGRYSGDDAKEMIVEKAEHLLKTGELDPRQEKAVHNLINALDD